jgi:hypothetical protein
LPAGMPSSSMPSSLGSGGALCSAHCSIA